MNDSSKFPMGLHKLFFIFIIVFIASRLSAQFNVINSWNFENQATDLYTSAEVAGDFNVYNNYMHGKEYIVNDIINGQTTKVLKALHDADEYYDGFQLNAWINSSRTAYREVYMTYNIKFGKEWNSTTGGKLPGIRSFPPISVPPATDQGFYAAPMFKQAGTMIAYHYDRTISNGAENPWSSVPTFGTVHLSNGTWHNITQRIVKNTFTNGSPNADGINEIWIDGKLVFQEKNLKLLSMDSKGIDGFFLGTYYGGGSIDYTPVYQCDVYLDNVVIWTPSGDNTFGTRGLHSSSQILNTPAQITDRQFYYDKLITAAGTISNTQYGKTYSQCIDEGYLIDAGDGNHTNLNVSNYFIGGGDVLLVYDGNKTDSKLLKEISGSGSNITLTGSGRYMFVRFSTNRESESTGWKGSVSFQTGSSGGQTTEPPVASGNPDAPSSLKIKAFSQSSISLSWRDNSSNEDNFIISRYASTNSSEITDVKVNANDTAYTDNTVKSGTTYIYSVKAINASGASAESNKNVAAALSATEARRIWTGIAAYYNFAYNQDMTVYDIAGNGEPVNLKLSQTSAVLWGNTGTLKITSPTSLVSASPATDIISGIKKTNEITFECWINPSEPTKTGKTRIFSVGSSNSDLGFALDQNFTTSNGKRTITYSARLNTGTATGLPELVTIRSDSVSINLHHVVYTRNSEGQETLYIDGKKAASGTRAGNFSLWKEGYVMKLGNDFDNALPWQGGYYAVAIYAGALSQSQVISNYNAGAGGSAVRKGMRYTVSMTSNKVENLYTAEISPDGTADMIEPVSVSILDSQGIMLFNEYLFNPHKEFKKTFDLQELTKGIYFLQVISGNEKNTIKLTR
jgi:hypothetical protein